MHANFQAEAATTAAQAMGQVQMLQWQAQCFNGLGRSDVPPISNLLMRESEAWRAALNLHNSVLHSAKHAAAAPELDEGSEHRDQAYCSALSSLAVQCDALHLEALKIRSLRKARRSLECDVVKELVRAHNNEILAIGQTLASQSAVALSAITAEIRAKIQSEKNHLTQLRSVLDAIGDAQHVKLDGKSLVIGVQHEDGDVTSESLQAFLQALYSDFRELTEKSVSYTLARRLLRTPVEREQPRVQFARRANDRDLLSDVAEQPAMHGA